MARRRGEGGRSVVRRVVVVGIVLAVVLTPLMGWAQSKAVLPPIMPLRDIKPGMRGIGHTVIQGQKIEEFDIEIMGILQGGGDVIPVRHLILFRASGPVTDRSGGTAAGMSGSPLFINGKLIGALSAGYLWQPGKRELALGTPIEEMLTVLDLPNGTAQIPWPRTFAASEPFHIGRRAITRVVVTDTLAQAQRVDEAGLPGTTAFIPATFPVMVSGLSPRAMGFLRQALGAAQPLLQYDQQGATFVASPITGGSSVGILQVRGDVSYGGMCTVTLRVGDRLLICGHPWDQMGEVEYALTTSDIVTVVRTLQEPFKEGNLGDLIGKIDQDRGPAIRGVIGRMPRMLAVRVAVTDLDAGTRIEKGVQVVRRREVGPGDRLRVHLTLRPFQEQTVPSRVIEISIPRDFPRGPAVLVVGSAGRQVSLESVPEQGLVQLLQQEPQPSPASTLDGAIQLFEDYGKNTDILLQLIPFGLPPEGSEFVKFDVFAGEVVRTDWVVQGEIQIPILIR